MIRVRKHVVLLMGIFLLAIGEWGGNSTSGGSGSGKQIVSVATVQPDSHPISIGLRAMKDYIEQNLGDKYEVKIYYNSIMGDNTQALELLQIGTLNLVGNEGSNLESFDNMYKIFGMPYLFNDEASFRKCMNTESFANEIYKCTRSKGIEGVTWFPQWSKYLFCNTGLYTG